MKSFLASTALIIALLAAPLTAAAQGADVALGGADYDADAAVEVTADSLSVDQGDGSAVFEGNVLVVQGDLRLSAGRITVEYRDGGGIARLVASDGVTFTSGAEAAEAQEATYELGSRRIVMSGDVLLTQANTAISGERLTIDLESGTGRVEGQVRTILQTGDQ